MRLVRNILEGVAGLEIYPIIGILVFLAFFVGVVVWVLRMKKNKVDAYSRIPLDDDDNPSIENKDSSKQQSDSK